MPARSLRPGTWRSGLHKPDRASASYVIAGKDHPITGEGHRRLCIHNKNWFAVIRLPGRSDQGRLCMQSLIFPDAAQKGERMLAGFRSRRRISAFLFCLSFASAIDAQAVITNISVAGITNTQAILTWTAPDQQPCTVQVSESATLTPVVHDVDAAIFPGSNVDNRDGSITDGRARKFVVGKRAAEKGSDGVRYSRALQSYTPHYFRITCGSDQAMGQFTTQPIAFGNTFQDPAPVDETGGGYAWPDLSPTDRKQTIVDPQTGALIRRVSMETDRVIPIDNESNMMAVSSGRWSNPGAAASNGDNGAAATIAGDNQSTLRIAPGFGSYFTGNILSDVASQGSVNYFQLALTASISNSRCNSSPTDDCKIIVCLTILECWHLLMSHITLIQDFPVSTENTNTFSVKVRWS